MNRANIADLILSRLEGGSKKLENYRQLWGERPGP
jgi:hypothetical protein